MSGTATKKAQDALASATRMESWLLAKFDRMPLWVRVVTYLLVVMTVVHGQLKDTVIQGDLYIKDNGKKYAARDYTISVGDSSFKVNSSGKWAVTTSRFFPGSVTGLIGDDTNTTVSEVGIPMPIPIWSGLFPRRVLIYVDKQDGTVTSKPIAWRDWIDPGVSAAAQRPAQQALAPQRLFVTLTRLRIKDIKGDADAQLFFILYANRQHFSPVGVPNLKYKNSLLPVTANSTTELQNMTFAVPGVNAGFRELEFGVRVYDYNSCWFCNNPDPDDELGVLKTYIKPGDVNKEIQLSPIASKNKIATGNVEMWITATIR